jgi:tetratricopeptide (TPR) repeat protein
MAENPRIEELRRRVQLDPASIAFAALAEEFRRMGRHDEAIETCRAGLQRHPAYLSARVTLGRALIETGEYDAAREELETVLRSAPENLAAIRGLAQIHERLGHSTEMDPHVAAMMNAEVERVALAAAAAAQAPPAPPEPVAAPAPVPAAAPPPAAAAAPAPPPVPMPIPISAPAPAPAAVPDFQTAAPLQPPAAPEEAEEPDDVEEPLASLELEAPSEPPVYLATLARLERLLVAIDAARHP